MFSDEVCNRLAQTIQVIDDGTELIVTDVGAGGAQLTLALADRFADWPWIQFEAIDLRAAPPSLPPSINWRDYPHGRLDRERNTEFGRKR